MSHVLVVGGGIAALSAALRLRDRCGPRLRITVVEQADRLGGKIRTGDLAGLPIETGAETILARRPEGLDLIERLGLSDRLVNPAPIPAGLSLDGALRDLPRGTLMGIPADAASVYGLVSAASAAAIAGESDDGTPLLGESDISVGAVVRERFGDEVTDKFVDPLLGGVYAGRADDLSLAVTIPTLAAQARRHGTLAGAVRASLPQAPADGPVKPVFVSVTGGLSTVVTALAEAARADIRLGLPVRRLNRTDTGWRAVVGSTRDPLLLDADAVVLAVPARPAARLLSDAIPAAAAELGVLDYASVGLVTIAMPKAELPHRSGFLVPATEGRAVKAATFFTRKWPHLAPEGLDVARMSIGRYGDTEELRRDDAELITLAHRELAAIIARPLPKPVAANVQRWGGGLPQYTPGHLDRVVSARRAMAPHPIAIAGAAVDGVGIPACIASGHTAAEHIAELLPNVGPRARSD